MFGKTMYWQKARRTQKQVPPIARGLHLAKPSWEDCYPNALIEANLAKIAVPRVRKTRNRAYSSAQSSGTLSHPATASRKRPVDSAATFFTWILTCAFEF